MHKEVEIDRATIVEWAEHRADDAGRLARLILSERNRAKESLEWCLAEINGTTVYDNEDQYHACMERVEADLWALSAADTQ